MNSHVAKGVRPNRVLDWGWLGVLLIPAAFFTYLMVKEPTASGVSRGYLALLVAIFIARTIYRRRNRANAEFSDAIKKGCEGKRGG